MTSSVLRSHKLHDQPAEECTLSGVWRKVGSASQSLSPACDLIEMNWLLRRGLWLVRTLIIEDSTEYFQTDLRVLRVVDFIEKYPWDGSERYFRRRDLRGGKQVGRVEQSDQGPVTIVSWQDPAAAEQRDCYEMSEDGQTLTVHSCVTRRDSGKQVTTDIVFRRVK